MTKNILIGEIKLLFSPLDLLLKLVLPFAISYILYRLLSFLSQNLIKRLKIIKKEENKQQIYKITRRVLRILFMLTFIAIIINFMGEEISKYVNSFLKVLTTPFYESGSTRLTVITVLLTIPLFILGSWISKKLKNFMDKTLLARLELDASTKFSVSKLMRYIIFVLIILIELSVIGIDLSSLAVIFGVLGIGVGFGLQGIVSNLFSGLVIFLERPIKEGDRIMIDNIEGTVVHIRLMSTLISTLTNETIFIPNSKLMSNYIHNNSYGSPKIIICNQIAIAYDSHIEEVRKTLETIGKANPYGLAHSDVEVRLVEFQDSGILMELRTWIASASKKHQAQSWTNFEIAHSFEKNNINIPFPQQDLWVRNWPNNLEKIQDK